MCVCVCVAAERGGRHVPRDDARAAGIANEKLERNVCMNVGSQLARGERKKRRRRRRISWCSAAHTHTHTHTHTLNNALL